MYKYNWREEGFEMEISLKIGKWKKDMTIKNN